MGGDRVSAKDIPGNRAVSIHTPVWGVTLPLLTPYPVLRGFNPHPRMGGDRRYSYLFLA